MLLVLQTLSLEVSKKQLLNQKSNCTYGAAPMAISIRLASFIFPGVPRLNAAGFINAEIGNYTAAKPTKL